MPNNEEDKKRRVAITIGDIFVGVVSKEKQPNGWMACAWNGNVVGYYNTQIEAENKLREYCGEILKTTPGWGIRKGE